MVSSIPQNHCPHPGCACDLTGESGLAKGFKKGRPGTWECRPRRASVWAAGLCSTWAPHTISAACPRAVCTAERGSRVRAENPRVLGLASKGTRSRCCHGEKGETEVGRAWCECGWLGGLAPSPDRASQAWLQDPGLCLTLPCDRELGPRHRCLAWAPWACLCAQERGSQARPKAQTWGSL